MIAFWEDVSGRGLGRLLTELTGHREAGSGLVLSEWGCLGRGGTS